MATAAVLPAARGRHRYRRGRRPVRSSRRLVPVLLDLLLAVVICAVGFEYGAGFLQVHEARWVANVLTLVGVDSVSETSRSSRSSRSPCCCSSARSRN